MADIKLAVRKLLRTPFITFVAVVSLALGIGANAAIFSIFDQILLHELDVPSPDQLVNLSAPGPKPGSQSCTTSGSCEDVFSYPMLRDLQAAESTGFASIAGHRPFGVNIALGDRTMDGDGFLVTGSYFSTLGVRPALGRLLQPSDDEVPGEHPVVVLSHRYWQGTLGGDPSVLNQRVVINGTPMTVVGVAQAGFEGTTLGVRPDLFIPLSMRGTAVPGWDQFENRRSYWVYVFGRLAEGVSVEQAGARINQVYAAIINDVEAELQTMLTEPRMEEFRQKQLVLSAGEQGQSSIYEDSRAPLYLLLGITGLVLLIACANIANLLLAKGAQRSTEMAVRGSMGATRSQLLRQLLVEALLLAAVGGAAGLAVAQLTLVGMASILPAQNAAILELGLSTEVLLFTAVIAVGTGFLFGLYPAVNATRMDLVTSLKAGTGQTSGARSAARFRTGLVTLQIALSMALLVAAGLFIKSLANVSRVELGIQTENMIQFGVSPELNGYEPERSHILFERLTEELGAVPGASAVTSSMIVPLAGNSWGTDVAVQGFEGGPGVDQNSRYNLIGVDYFSTLGTPLVAGREFTRSDGADAPLVAIVNEAFAEKFEMELGEVVGSFMSLDSHAAGSDLNIEIVGLVQDHKYNAVKGEVPPVFYRPYRQDETLGFLNFYVRTDGDPSSVIRAVPGVVHGLDPNLPVEDLKTMEQQAAESVFVDRMISIMSTSFAVLATLLASIGLYGVLSYTVAQRTREIGLRMALGADTSRVRQLVLRQVMGMLLVGGVIGLAAALALGRAAGSLLYELEGHDPVVLSASVALLALVALGAGYLPAFRASRVDPMEALRYE